MYMEKISSKLQKEKIQTFLDLFAIYNYTPPNISLVHVAKGKDFLIHIFLQPSFCHSHPQMFNGLCLVFQLCRYTNLIENN